MSEKIPTRLYLLSRKGIVLGLCAEGRVVEVGELKETKEDVFDYDAGFLLPDQTFRNIFLPCPLCDCITEHTVSIDGEVCTSCGTLHDGDLNCYVWDAY